MSIATLLLLATLMGNTNAVRSEWTSFEPVGLSNTLRGSCYKISDSQIKITIAIGGGPYGPIKSSHRAGEPIPLVITMTNTGGEPVSVCQSGAIYQDRPQLLRNGAPVAYKSFRQSMVDTAAKDRTCQNDNLPQQILLQPNEPTVVDWFNLAEGAASLNDDGWYEPLPPGKYTLTDRRRLSCCDGAFVETNTVDFVVVP